MRSFLISMLVAAVATFLVIAGQSTAQPPLHRAVASEILAANGQAENGPELRKSLSDPKPLVRLHAALALVQRDDEQAVGVLIDLLADLPVAERRQVEQALQQLGGEWSPNPTLAGEDEVARTIRREVWAGWWRMMDGPTLLTTFRERTFTKENQARVQAQNEKKGTVPAAAARLLAVRKPAGAAEALLAFLPCTDDYALKEEIGKALKKLALPGGKADPVVLQALSDPLAVRRCAAAEALASAGGAAQWPAVRTLLNDPDAEVRLRVAVALVCAHDKQTVPVLIDLAAELPRSQTWEALSLLDHLAGDKAPRLLAGDDAASRNELRDAWQAWWKEHAATVDLKDLEKTSGVLGLTIVAEVFSKANPVANKKAGIPLPNPVGTGRLVGLDRNGQPRWQIENLGHPIDFQVLPGGRLLIAEHTAKRVTERDVTGTILWEATNLPSAPTNVQRLANGNTFIALYAAPFETTGGIWLLEVDRQGKTVATFNSDAQSKVLPGKGMVGAAHKVPDGRMICLSTGGDCIWLDAKGQFIKRFAVPSLTHDVTSYANIDVTSKGHILVAHKNDTVEYDADGKIAWKATVGGNRATRLPNNNTLVATATAGVIEFDNAGRTVWKYEPPPGYQALRARRAGR